MRQCARLQQGDTIGIVAPSGPVKPADLEQAIALITARGYRVVVGEHVLASMPGNAYLAGTDAQRAHDLNQMFARPDVKAVFAARGGYGAMRLFDLLDTDVLRANPKIFTGYSDITSLHLVLSHITDGITFHSPNATSLRNLDAQASEVFWRSLEQPEPLGILPTIPDAMQTIVPGVAEGALAGGCICLLSHACGSRYQPNFNGKIVLLEDVGEAIYRVDRDLTQLRNAGAFDGATGFVIGAITRWQQQEADPPTNTPDALWQDFFTPLGKPALAGFPFGHEPNPLTLPLGVQARLDATNRTLTLLEAAVR